MTGTIDDRARRVAARLRPDQALLAGDPANVRWLLGTGGEPHEIYGNSPLWVAVGAGGGWAIIAGASELAWLEEAGLLDVAVGHGRFVFLGRPSAALASAASSGRSLEAAVSVALDAVDAGPLILLDDWARPSLLEAVAAACAPRGVERDAAPWHGARIVKTAAEVQSLRAAAHAAEDGIRNAVSRMRPGSRERDLLRWVGEAMLDHGARPLLGSIGTGPRGALVDFAPGDRRVRENEAVRFDVGCVLDGWHADLSRTAVVGELPAAVQHAHDAIVAGEEAAMAALRPGVCGEEVFEAAVGAARAAGLDAYDRTHVGHGIGTDMYEQPHLRPGERTPIPAGATMCVETPLYLAQVAGLQVEDPVVVTADGSSSLGTLPRIVLQGGQG